MGGVERLGESIGFGKQDAARGTGPGTGPGRRFAVIRSISVPRAGGEDLLLVVNDTSGSDGTNSASSL